MSALEPIPLDTLSDDEAVTLLFELVNHGEAARDRLQQVDALVYARLLRAYGNEQALPTPPGHAA